MQVSIKRILAIAALALIAAVAAVAASPVSTQAADQTYSPPHLSAPAWYGSCAYTVADGDDLFHIAMRFGVSPYYLSSSNGIYNPYFMYRGMVMQVPCVSSYPRSNYQSSGYPGYRSSGYGNYGQPYGNNGYGGYGGYGNYQSQSYSGNSCSVYFVRFGEWLSLIAARFGVPWQAVAALNHLYNPNFVFAGERLLIPCAQGYSTYSAPSNGYAPPANGYTAPSNGYTAPNNAGPTPTAGAFAAAMQNIMFMPSTINIHVGQSVVWKDLDSVQHSATQGTCSGNTCTPASGGFDTGILSPGQTSGAITFNTAGTFHFYCRVHGPMMQGDVVVTP